MTPHPQPEVFLIDGALAQQPRPASAVIAQMAADLVRLEAFSNEPDAIRALMWSGLYSSFEVMVYVDQPTIAKAKRNYAKHRGASVSQSPMRGGRRDAIKKRMDGTVVVRATGKPVFQRRG